MIVEAAASGIEVECSVLGNDDADRLAARRDPARRGRVRLVRLRGQVHVGRDGADRAGPDLRERARARAGARGGRPSRASGCTGLARADFFVDGETVLVNELNTMPGFTETSVYGALFAASGIPYARAARPARRRSRSSATSASAPTRSERRLGNLRHARGGLTDDTATLLRRSGLSGRDPHRDKELFRCQKPIRGRGSPGG